MSTVKLTQTLYHCRLDLLTSGYMRENLTGFIIPEEVVELVKLWHSSYECPILMLNLLTNSKTLGLTFEFYLDKNPGNIFNITKCKLIYNLVIGSEVLNGHQNITHFYDFEHFIGFCIINQSQFTFAEFTLQMLDSDDNILMETSKQFSSYIPDCQNRYDRHVAKSLRNVANNNRNVLLNDWMSTKHRLYISESNLLWRRIFFFANFRVQRNSNYCVNGSDLSNICKTYYCCEEYYNAISKLRSVGVSRVFTDK
eukprot:451219_1